MAGDVLKHSKLYLILFAAGVNLILIQWVLVRELTALLFGTELVVLLVSVAYFAGVSLGYLAAGRITRGMLTPLAVLTFGLHLTLPVWLRVLAVALDAVGAFALAFVALPVLSALVVPAFYSIFLPHFADSATQGVDTHGVGTEGVTLPSLYAVELSGSVCGVLVLVALGGLGVDVVLVVYSAALVLIVLSLGMWPLAAMTMALGAGLWLLAFPQINAWSNSLFFVGLQGMPEGTTTLFTGYSPYQKVDVLQAPDGDRYLYLDGLRHFGSASGSRLNVMMGQIPAALSEPETVLVIGAGSMEMERMIADYAKHVTTVEIDPLVVDVSLRYFDAANRMSQLENRTVLIDDAKHYAANTPETFDMIATDTPAAFTIQTATLYSEAFFRTLAARLNGGGVLVVNLTGTFREGNPVSRRVAAGLLAVFDEVMVVNAPSAGWGFAYAGEALPFTAEEIREALEASGEADAQVFTLAEVRDVVRDARPITLDSMDVVLHVSMRRLLRLWGVDA